MGFKTRFQGCSRKGGHENKNHYGTITPTETPNISFSNM